MRARANPAENDRVSSARSHFRLRTIFHEDRFVRSRCCHERDLCRKRRSRGPRKACQDRHVAARVDGVVSLFEGALSGSCRPGLVEGKNISFDVRFANGCIDQLPKLAAELAGSGVDLIFTSGDQAGKAVKPDDLDCAFTQAGGSGLTGAIVVYDPLFYLHRRELADFARRERIATVFNFREFVEAGGLMSYGPNVQSMCHQSAHLIKKVLAGEKAGEIPMEQPTRFELVINLNTAREIGLAIPSSLIGRADDVIE